MEWKWKLERFFCAPSLALEAMHRILPDDFYCISCNLAPFFSNNMPSGLRYLAILQLPSMAMLEVMLQTFSLRYCTFTTDMDGIGGLNPSVLLLEEGFWGKRA